MIISINLRKLQGHVIIAKSSSIMISIPDEKHFVYENQGLVAKNLTSVLKCSETPL